MNSGQPIGDLWSQIVENRTRVAGGVRFKRPSTKHLAKTSSFVVVSSSKESFLSREMKK